MLVQGVNSYTKIMPYFREERETSVESRTSVLQAMGGCLETKVAYLRLSQGHGTVLLPRNYKLSLVPKLSPERQVGAGNES